MKRTLDEKYDYNKRRMREAKDNAEKSFSSGYCMGVALYQGYPKANEKDRQKRRDAVDRIKIEARSGNAYSKGIMCGIRDAAKERKTGRGK